MKPNDDDFYFDPEVRFSGLCPVPRPSALDSGAIGNIVTTSPRLAFSETTIAMGYAVPAHLCACAFCALAR
ncbi:MAG: hypothetical protein KA252_05155, partial [Sphingorhabdus sp.]|nr:hypothetical protein [Sphingorhabdus sp.]